MAKLRSGNLSYKYRIVLEMIERMLDGKIKQRTHEVEGNFDLSSVLSFYDVLDETKFHLIEMNSIYVEFFEELRQNTVDLDICIKAAKFILEERKNIMKSFDELNKVNPNHFDIVRIIE
mmetsp:Transcript_34219/g.30950  ORF Transcript_34219/g.30950 Transcript_34219/m.30950 type:complete len:119 (-) Transcript_34219:1056-1412(-)